MAKQRQSSDRGRGGSATNRFPKVKGTAQVSAGKGTKGVKPNLGKKTKKS